jgi:hypothetical protein
VSNRANADANPHTDAVPNAKRDADALSVADGR